MPVTRRRGGASKADDAEPSSKPLVLDYRNPRAGWCRRMMGLAYSFFVINYLWWGTVAAVALYVVAATGPLGTFVAVGAVLLYIPRFLRPTQKKLGAPWHGFRQLGLWRLTQEYLGLRVIRTHALDASKGPYIFSIHPHGIIILSRVATYGGTWEACFPGIEQRTLGASPMFYLPGVRDMSLWMGAVDASRHVAERILDAKLSLMVYPGGSKEIFHTLPGSSETKLELKSRYGFLKLAMKKGTPVVPAFVFGEKHCYRRYIFPEAWVKWALKTLRIPLLLFWGRWGTLLPFKPAAGLGVVYGAPMDLPHTDSPTQEQLDDAMTRYCAEVQTLFDDHKATFGYDDKETLKMV